MMVWRRRHRPIEWPEERITVLPDTIKLEILIRLSRKDCIRTGVLSTAWKDLWKQRFPYDPELVFVKPYENDEEQEKYVLEIGSGMQEYLDKKIEKFVLSFNPGDAYDSLVKEWIRQAVEHGVEELRLDFSQGLMTYYPEGKLVYGKKRPQLKERIFRDNSVILMSLGYCRLYRTFRFEHFPALQHLSLHATNISDWSLEKAVANCKLLEVLSLGECMTLQCIRVCGPQLQLKALYVAHCWQVDVIEISAPNLRVFHLIGRLPTFFHFTNLLSLENVLLTSKSELNWLGSNYLSPILMSLNCVKVLSLRGRGVQSLFGPLGAVASGALPRLRELDLCMKLVEVEDVIGIFKFFEMWRVPCLEKLLIELPNVLEDMSTRSLLDRIPKGPWFPLEQLKMIQMNDFQGDLPQLLLLVHLLHRAVSLEHVMLVLPRVFDVSEDCKYIKEIYLSLLKVPRASANAQILMCYNAQA